MLHLSAKGRGRFASSVAKRVRGLSSSSPGVWKNPSPGCLCDDIRPPHRGEVKKSTELAMEDLWRLSAETIAGLIRSKKASAMDAATAALARLEVVNPKINAVVDYRPEDVLAHARGIDAAIERGEDPGPLAGVPVTVKVNI